MHDKLSILKQQNDWKIIMLQNAISIMYYLKYILVDYRIKILFQSFPLLTTLVPWMCSAEQQFGFCIRLCHCDGLGDTEI